MSWMAKTKLQFNDAAINQSNKNSNDDGVTRPNPGNETMIRQAGVSANSDSNESLWKRLWKIITDAWHQLINTILKG